MAYKEATRVNLGDDYYVLALKLKACSIAKKHKDDSREDYKIYIDLKAKTKKYLVEIMEEL